MLIKKFFFSKDTKAFSKTFIDQCVVSGGNFLSTFILIKILGLKDFGIFSEIWIVIISLNIIQQAIIISPLLSVSSKLISFEKDDYISNIHFFQLIFSVFLSLLLFFLIKIFGNFIDIDSRNNLGILFIIISMFSLQLHEFYRKTIYVNSELLNLIKFDITRYFSQIFLLILFLSKGYKSPISIFIIYFLACFISILLNVKCIPKIWINKKSFTKYFKRNWLISKWLFSQSIISWFQSNYLLFLTNFTLGPFSLGLIRAFQSILGINNIFLNSIDSWLPVKTAEIFKEKSPSNFRKSINQIILNYYFLFLVVFLFFIIFSNLILFFFDKSTLNYLFSFRLFCITYLLIALNYPIKGILLGIEKTVSNFYSSIFSVFLILTLGSYLIKIFSLNGVMLTYITYQLAILLTNAFYLRKKLLYLK